MKTQNQILSWLRTEKKGKETLTDCVRKILKNAKKKKEFFDLIIRNPRDNKSAYRAIAASFSSATERRAWLRDYCRVFTNYMNRHLKQSNHVEDIVRIMPNLLPWTLVQRFRKIQMGAIPPIFGDETDLWRLIKRINSSEAVKTFLHIKTLECNLGEFKKAFPAVRKIDWFDFDARTQFLKTLLKEKCGKPFRFGRGIIGYQVQFLCNPFSNKMVFRVVAPDGSVFILKETPYPFLPQTNDRIRKEHENTAIRSDSTYSDALLEFYLKLNNCPHAPNILFYDYDHEVAIYAEENGSPLKLKNKSGDYRDFYTFNAQYLPDSMRLGVYVNDINEGNFLISDQDGAVKIIDIGHASFVNPLTPGVPGLTMTLGNLCGQDSLSVHGILDMEDV